MLSYDWLMFQTSLYYTLKRGVDGFRTLVGAPDTPRWNSVLFGGQTSILLYFKFFFFISPF